MRAAHANAMVTRARRLALPWALVPLLCYFLLILNWQLWQIIAGYERWVGDWPPPSASLIWGPSVKSVGGAWLWGRGSSGSSNRNDSREEATEAGGEVGGGACTLTWNLPTHREGRVQEQSREPRCLCSSKALSLQGCGGVWNASHSLCHPPPRSGAKAGPIPRASGAGFRRRCHPPHIGPQNTSDAPAGPQVAPPRCWRSRGQKAPPPGGSSLLQAPLQQALPGVWSCARPRPSGHSPGFCSDPPCRPLLFLQVRLRGTLQGGLFPTYPSQIPPTVLPHSPASLARSHRCTPHHSPPLAHKRRSLKSLPAGPGA